MEDEQTQPASETVVGADVKIKGNLKSPSNIQIFGQVKGEVNSEADIFIGEGAKIEGSVSGRQVTIAGEILGNLGAAEKLEINATGKLQGDIKTPDLIIQSGAKFMGKCEMPDAEISTTSEEAAPKAETDEALEELEETIKE